MNATATPAQLVYLDALLDERVLPFSADAFVHDLFKNGVTKAAASWAIDLLKRLPRK